MDTTLKPLPLELQRIEAEMRAYYRELPQLLEKGEKGKYLVIRGDSTHQVWDSLRDALNFGYDKFQDSQFLAQKIDDRLLPYLAQHFGPHPSITSEVA